MAAALLAVALLVWGVVSLLGAPLFSVRTVTVSGERHLSREDVLLRASIPTGSPLLALDAAAVKKRLEADPWVARAVVQKDLPGTVRVTVIERVPTAIVDSGGTDLNVVASDGTWLGQRSAEETGLIVIRDLTDVDPRPGAKATSPELMNALKLIAGLSPQLLGMAEAISAPTIDKTLLLTDKDVEIFFGEAVDVSRKDKIARAILAKERENVVYINVRTVEDPIYRGLKQDP